MARTYTSLGALTTDSRKEPGGQEGPIIRCLKLALILLLVLPAIAPGQSEAAGTCDAILAVKEFVVDSETHYFLEAIASLYSRDELKRAAESLRIGIPAIIDADGKGWRDARDRVSRGEAQFRSSASARSYLMSRPAAGVVEKWAECMKNKGAQFFSFLRNDEGNDLAVTVVWSKGEGDPSKLTLRNPRPELAAQLAKPTELNQGRVSFKLPRPQPGSQPEVVTFNGHYELTPGSSRNVESVLVLWPRAEVTTAPPRSITITATGISSRGKCDRPGYDGRNEFEVTLSLSGEKMHGPKVYPVPSSGFTSLRNVQITRTVTTPEPIPLALEIFESDHGDRNSTRGQDIHMVSSSTNDPTQFELEATVITPANRRCTAKLQFVASVNTVARSWADAREASQAGEE